jgi:hypothetical protein
MDSSCRVRDALRPRNVVALSPPVRAIGETSSWSLEMVAVIAGTVGAALVAVGSHLVIPIGVEVGSLLSLVGIGSMMLSFGLADGE